MHLLLTDRLTCPRCGPTFGLVLLADLMDERRVIEGWLGCPNCRDRFPVTGGFGDLRAPPREELGPGLAGRPGAAGPGPAGVGRALGSGRTVDAGDAAPGPLGAEHGSDPGGMPEADRLRALLGLTRGPGTIVLAGEPARHGAALAGALEDVQVVGIDPDLRFWPEAPGLSRLASRPGIPFFGGVLRGVVVDARLGSGWLDEAARVVAPMSRVVVAHAEEETAPKLQRLGLTLLAAEAETIVAARA